MKKYHLFCYNPYQSTGASDYCKSYETVEAAQADYFKVYERAYYLAEIMETQPDGSLVIVSWLGEKWENGKEVRRWRNGSD